MNLFYSLQKAFHPWSRLLIFGLILLVTAVACNPKEGVNTVDQGLPEKFHQRDSINPPALAQRWWTSFQDAQLDSLVALALDSNFQLKSTWYRFEAARAVVDRESSAWWPEIEAFTTSGISRPEPDFVGGENLRFGLQARYEVDLWGRIGAQIKAEKYRAQASLRDYQAGAISLSAEITRVWFGLEAAQMQLNLANEQVQTNSKILRLIKVRFGNGQVRGVDILRQSQLVEAARQRMQAQQAEVALWRNQLKVLIGHFPAEEATLKLDSLPDLPPLPETGLPTLWLQRRPDVQSAFSRLNAADREMASAISAQYPRFDINTNYSSRSNDADELFQSWAYSLGGNLLAPLFYGGRLRAEVDRTEAVKMQRAHEYSQTVLNAYREVKDALVQEDRQKNQIQSLERQVKLTTSSARQLRLQYLNGSAVYLDVLNVINQAQQLQRDLIQARLQLLQFRVNLHRALAGPIVTPRSMNVENQVEG